MSDVADIVGEVCSGQGEGRVFTRLDWARRAFADKLGFTPFPGTFNLRGRDPRWVDLRTELWLRPGIAIEPPPGFCAAKCFRALLEGAIDTALIIPEVRDYPPEKIELIAAVPIRAVLGVANGDCLKLCIDLGAKEPVVPATSLTGAALQENAGEENGRHILA